MLDGRLIGYLDPNLADNFCQSLRFLKIKQDKE